ncbi:MAG: hypothetical protein GX167_02715 [Firmicutes bacterium]|nr:hypothetical protein [Bacillota bacterium]
MPYLLLVIGLLLILLAALWLGQKSEESVAEQYNGEKNSPLADGESAAILRLTETVEGALAELDEKNRVLQKMINQGNFRQGR